MAIVSLLYEYMISNCPSRYDPSGILFETEERPSTNFIDGRREYVRGAPVGGVCHSIHFLCQHRDTMLHIAVENGHVAVSQWLIDHCPWLMDITKPTVRCERRDNAV